MTATAADGSEVAIRATAGGLLAILRDGAETSATRWTREQWEACVAEFARLAGVCAPPPRSGHGDV